MEDPAQGNLESNVSDVKGNNNDVENDVDVASNETFVVQGPADKSKCLFTGIALFENGRIIMADFNNRSIKLLSSDRHSMTQLLLSVDKQLHTIEMPVRPWGVAVTNDNEAVATIPDIGRLQFIRVMENGNLGKGKLLGTEKECSGIGCAKERLYVSYTHHPCIRILTLEGAVLKTVTCDSIGHKLFTNPLFLFVCQYSGIVSVSDRRNRAVVSLDLEGAVLNIRHTGDDEPYYVTSDMRENVYVCMKTGDEIRRLPSDGCGETTPLLSRRQLLGTPSAICVDNKNRQLIVTFDGLDKAAIFTNCIA